MLHAVVFDFDGVLADSEPLHFEAFRRVLALHDIALDEPEYYEKYLGFDDVGAFRAVFHDRNRTLDQRLMETMLEQKLEVFPAVLDGRQILFPDAAACVHRVAERVPVAIASGAFSHDIDLMLGGSGLRPAFRVVVGAEQTPRSKPHPDPYQRAVRLLQEQGAIPAGDGVAAGCVAIEDSKWGVQSAKAAGLRTIAVTTSYEADELAEADQVVKGLAEVSIEGLERLVAGP